MTERAMSKIPMADGVEQPLHLPDEARGARTHDSLASTREGGGRPEPAATAAD
jgi:hypothetical protein